MKHGVGPKICMSTLLCMTSNSSLLPFHNLSSAKSILSIHRYLNTRTLKLIRVSQSHRWNLCYSHWTWTHAVYNSLKFASNWKNYQFHPRPRTLRLHIQLLLTHPCNATRGDCPTQIWPSYFLWNSFPSPLIMKPKLLGLVLKTHQNQAPAFTSATLLTPHDPTRMSCLTMFLAFVSLHVLLPPLTRFPHICFWPQIALIILALKKKFLIALNKSFNILYGNSFIVRVLQETVNTHYSRQWEWCLQFYIVMPIT